MTDVRDDMSPDQALAYEMLLGEGDVHIDGPAGTGKSFLLNTWSRGLKARERPLRAASTASAARLIGGKTVNSLFGIAPEVHIPGSILSQKREDIPDNSVWNFQVLANAPAIVIDEISMTRIDMFQAILERMKQVTKLFRTKPGRPRLITVGDFSQLSPVVTDKEKEVLDHYYHGRVFAFEHKFWEGMREVALTTVHRQRDDLIFANWLNKIREGRVPDLDWINAFVRPAQEGAVNLVTRREQAAKINAEEMAKLPGNPVIMRGDSQGTSESGQPVPTELAIKIGSRVIICANQQGSNENGVKDYVNGTTGEFVGLCRDRNGKVAASVKLDDGRQVVVGRHTWRTADYEKVEDNGKVAGYRMVEGGRFSQFPLLPGWAITVHRSQGMSIPKAHVDVKGTFAAGQVYVALSRLTSTDGLSLSSRVSYEHIIQDSRVRARSARIAAAAAAGQRLEEPETAPGMN